MPNREDRSHSRFSFFALDALMILLLVVNLTWIVFDWLFEYEILRDGLYSIAPGFTDWYASAIHPRFILIDLMFISVFLTEFFIRWGMAIYHRVYHRWFFFPFIHFYDLLGCIPLGGFRFLRLLRIFSIVYRLQKSGIIDLSETALFSFIRKYYGILIGELSDKVTLNILSDIQQEVRNGGPVVDRIVGEVVMPQKENLVEWISHRVEKVSADNYARYREDIREYVRERISLAVEENREMARLDQIPVFGSLIRQTISQAIHDITFNVINGIMQDLASDRNRLLIDESADILFDAILLKEEDSELNRMVVETIDRSIEIVKQQVGIQQWKLRDLAEDEEDFQRRLRDAIISAPDGRSAAESEENEGDPGDSGGSDPVEEKHDDGRSSSAPNR
ncbi:hypothetical protein QA596_00060 [Balneolales bacterium ANBcel1]|nr:hypothetical protein [Balneolales bacterium ANBcel1]